MCLSLVHLFKIDSGLQILLFIWINLVGDDSHLINLYYSVSVQEKNFILRYGYSKDLKHWYFFFLFNVELFSLCINKSVTQRISSSAAINCELRKLYVVNKFCIRILSTRYCKIVYTLNLFWIDLPHFSTHVVLNGTYLALIKCYNTILLYIYHTCKYQNVA